MGSTAGIHAGISWIRTKGQPVPFLLSLVQPRPPLSLLLLPPALEFYSACIVEADLQFLILLLQNIMCPQELLKQFKWYLLKRAFARISLVRGPWDGCEYKICVVSPP